MGRAANSRAQCRSGFSKYVDAPRDNFVVDSHVCAYIRIDVCVSAFLDCEMRKYLHFTLADVPRKSARIAWLRALECFAAQLAVHFMWNTGIFTFPDCKLIE